MRIPIAAFLVAAVCSTVFADDKLDRDLRHAIFNGDAPATAAALKAGANPNAEIGGRGLVEEAVHLRDVPALKALQ